LSSDLLAKKHTKSKLKIMHANIVTKGKQEKYFFVNKTDIETYFFIPDVFRCFLAHTIGSRNMGKKIKVHKNQKIIV